jgi:hypothetical protein
LGNIIKKILPLLAIFQLQPISGAQEVWMTVDVPGVGLQRICVATVKGSLSVTRGASFQETVNGVPTISSHTFFISATAARFITYKDNPVTDVDKARSSIALLLKKAFIRYGLSLEGNGELDNTQTFLFNKLCGFSFSYIRKNI